MISPLENCLIAIAKNHDGNGTLSSDKDYLSRGAQIVKDKIIEEENPVYLNRVEAAEILFNLGGTKDLSSARGILEGISNQEIYCGEGTIYFESVDRAIAVGYSSDL